MLGFVQSAAAWYFAGGRATDDYGNQYLAYGSSGASYMYPKQSPQDDDWVNSIYTRRDDGSWVEAGWYWKPGGTSRVWFTQAFSVDFGLMGERYFTVANAPNGSRPVVTVRRFSTTADYHAVWVDNVLKYQWTLLPFRITSCRADVGAERYSLSDSNRGSWMYAKAARADLSWGYWQGAGATYPVGGGAQPDPSYFFFNNYVDRSDHFVYVDDHQN
jgi:hypothetical protein